MSENVLDKVMVLPLLMNCVLFYKAVPMVVRSWIANDLVCKGHRNEL